jgi:hypothetical protein
MQMNNQYIQRDINNSNKEGNIDNNCVNEDKSEGEPDESINNISSIMPMEEDANISELN